MFEQRETGIVKWFNSAKGYGFIERENGDDIFVHYTAVRGTGYRTLTDQQKVEFTIVEGEKGLQAQDVVKLEPDVLVPDIEVNIPPIDKYND